MFSRSVQDNVLWSFVACACRLGAWHWRNGPMHVGQHHHEALILSWMQTGDCLLPAQARFLHSSRTCRDQEQQSAVQDACRVHSSQQQPREQQQGQQQHKALYVFNVEGRRWNAPLLLGLLDHFERLYTNVVGTSVSAFCAAVPATWAWCITLGVPESVTSRSGVPAHATRHRLLFCKRRASSSPSRGCRTRALLQGCRATWTCCTACSRCMATPRQCSASAGDRRWSAHCMPAQWQLKMQSCKGCKQAMLLWLAAGAAG